MRHTTTTATYTGTEVPGVRGTGEVLPTGAAVRVISIKRGIALVDLPSTAFGTGRTYTVWSVPATTVA